MKSYLLILSFFYISTVESIIKIDTSKFTTTTQKPTVPTEIEFTKNITSIQNTTVKPTNSITTTTEKPTEKKFDSNLTENNLSPIESRNIPSDYYCFCDLSVQFCDINCCCDIDCHTEQLSTFECTTEWSFRDYFQFIPFFQKCTHFFDIFCTVDNSNSILSEQDVEEEVQTEDVEYDWPSLFDQSNRKEIDRDTYRYGDGIFIFNESNDEIEVLELPYPLMGHTCGIMTPIHHLENQRILCPSNSIEMLMNFVRNLSHKKLLKSRRIIDKEMLAEHCVDGNVDQSECLSIHVAICQEWISNDSCELFNSTMDIDGNLSNIEIRFYHNFTNLENSSVYAIVKKGSVPMKLKVLEITVKFLQRNETETIRKISGNLGYLKEYPLICSKLISINQSELILDYFHPINPFHYRNFVLKLPKLNKLCRLDNFNWDTINFGENQRFRCMIQFEQIAINETTDFQKICQQFQQEIFSYLIPDLNVSGNETDFFKSNLLLSIFGNPKNRTTFWTPLTIQNPKRLMVKGNYDGKVDGMLEESIAERFTCENIILNVRYAFSWRYETVMGNEGQAVLLDGRLYLGKMVDLKFMVTDDGMTVPIYIDVIFKRIFLLNLS